MRKLNKKNKKKFYQRIITCIILIILLYMGLFYFISDDRNNNFLFKIIKDASSIIYRIRIVNNNDNSNLISEINKDYEKEIENLKKTLDLNNTLSDKVLKNATIIKRSTVYWYNIITIDKGKKDGIKEGYAAINYNGLIGKVIKVNNTTSDIKLLTNKSDNDYISALFYIEDKPYYGLISGYDIENNELYLKNVIGDFDINKIKGINVVTSGLSDSFSKGLLIGSINDIKKDTYGISNIIKITPASDFNNLNIITIIIGDKND